MISIKLPKDWNPQKGDWIEVPRMTLTLLKGAVGAEALGMKHSSRKRASVEAKKLFGFPMNYPLKLLTNVLSNLHNDMGDRMGLEFQFPLWRKNE